MNNNYRIYTYQYAFIKRNFGKSWPIIFGMEVAFAIYAIFDLGIKYGMKFLIFIVIIDLFSFLIYKAVECEKGKILEICHYGITVYNNKNEYEKSIPWDMIASLKAVDVAKCNGDCIRIGLNNGDSYLCIRDELAIQKILEHTKIVGPDAYRDVKKESERQAILIGTVVVILTPIIIIAWMLYTFYA